MASAILGGLLKQGFAAKNITVIDPSAETCTRLRNDWGVHALQAADSTLAQADAVLWAVKPQQFKEAALPVAPHTRHALHISVAAGITTAALENWLGSSRIVRCMPNTPALVGQGMTGLYAMPAVSDADRATVDALLAATGKLMWLEREELINSLMAISGSGPAYVFYWIEALVAGGVKLGLSAEQAKELAAQTFAGAAALVQASDEAPEVLRQRVTSKGGTTHEAIVSMQANHVEQHIVEAMQACYQRGQEMGREFVSNSPILFALTISPTKPRPATAHNQNQPVALQA